MNSLKSYFSSNSQFLVTGGTGFIGSNIVEKILDLGFKVRVLDNFSTGRKDNIQEFRNHTNFEFMEGDIRDIDVCQQACMGVDYVLHQAALGSVPRSINNPIATHEVNITGTLNMMVAARDYKVKRFVYASSSSVYGDDKTLPKREENIGKPLSPYAVTKRAVELYARNFYELFNLPVIGLRYFNVFGKKQDPNSIYAAVIPNFINKLMENDSPVIHGGGSQSRDFTFVDNVVQANLKACISNEETLGHVFNIGCGNQTTISDLFQILNDLLGKNISPLFKEERIGDVRASDADISKAKQYLGYYPEYNIYEGLSLTVEWFKANRISTNL